MSTLPDLQMDEKSVDYLKYCVTHQLLIVCSLCALRYRERGNIEVLFFNIQAKLKAGGRRLYIPPEGRLVRDIESGWIRLEKAEHDRELALREELIRSNF